MNVTRTEAAGGDIILTAFAPTRDDFESAKVALMNSIDAETGYRLVRASAKHHDGGRTFQARMERDQ